MAAPVLVAHNITVRTRRGEKLVDVASLSIERGERLALLGPSGAGKSLLMQAIAGLTPAELIAEGTFHPCTSQRSTPPRALYLVQQAMGAWDPLVRIGTQLEEGARAAGIPQKGLRTRLIEILKSLGFTEPEQLLRRYPCELSGGMQQRLMLAAALLSPPELLIADESVSALEPALRDEVLQVLESLRTQAGSALVLITHDLALAAKWADRVLIMDQGRVVEIGKAEILRAPKSAVGAALLAARLKTLRAAEAALTRSPPAVTERARSGQPPFLEVRGLVKRYPCGFGKHIDVLRGIDLALPAGQTVGLVAASGTGKSTLARLILGFERADAGAISVEGVPLSNWLTGHRGEVSVVFQDYVDSLNPKMCVAEAILEPLRILGAPTAGVAEHLLEVVGLGTDMASRLPHELSGGQAQRVALARALSTNPRLLVFDEALSSLDSAVQGEMVALLRRIKTRHMTWLFITHDLEVAAALCDELLVMEKGRISLSAPIAEALQSEHAFVRRMLAASPTLSAHCHREMNH